MNMRRLILSTCGTSLLTNVDPKQRNLVYQYANASKSEEIPSEDRQSLQTLVEIAQEKLLRSTAGEQAKLSAELNGLLCYYEGRFDPGQDIHWLIVTDTWLGEANGQAVKKVLEAHYSVEIKRITDLRTDNLEEFRVGMSELIRLCAQEIKGMQESKYRIVFNLTGGFKGVNGFMQALGMLYADESIYVFESSSKLLKLPKLPINLNARGLGEQFQRVFRRHDARLPISREDCGDMPDTLLMEVEGAGITLSVWGEAVWQEVRNDILSEKLLPPIDAKLCYDVGFEKTLQKCSEQEFRQVNERLAELASYLNGGPNPSRLDLKKLAVPQSQCTHECDAWAQGGAKRLFGYFADGVFVVVKLDKGLH
jgi:putative CRISPR-associated protein (TIGR02619 family)